MLELFITTAVVLALLLVNEWWWRGRKHGEISRKFVHITIGTFVAFWPLFLSWDQIRLLSAAFVLVVLISMRFNLFRAIHSVQRPTHGEIFFALAVGLLTFITKDPAVYAVALLHMGLADGLAAIIGVKYGDSTAYKVFGHRKSVAGTSAFLATSLCIFVAYTINEQLPLEPAYLGLAALAAATENVALKGFDNLAVPLLLAFALSAI